MPDGRNAPEFAVGVAVATYADHLPLERQVRMMARRAGRLANALGSNSGAGAAPRARLRGGRHTRARRTDDRILPGRSTDEGRQILGGDGGTVVVDGFAVYEVLGRIPLDNNADERALRGLRGNRPTWDGCVR
jgi:hypothetical protein